MSDTAADDAFGLFLATVEFEDLTRWEQRAYRWHQIVGPIDHTTPTAAAARRKQDTSMTTQQTVRVYSKPNCMQCRLTEKWLTEHQVPFLHDSAEDEGVILAARELGIAAAPIVVVQTKHPDIPGGFTDEVWGGFQPSKLEQHIDTEEFAA